MAGRKASSKRQIMQSMLAHGYTLDEVMEVVQCEEGSEEAGKGCKAIQDMREEERELGWQENKRQTIRNMLSRGYAFVDIMSIAECSEEEIAEVQKNMR